MRKFLLLAFVLVAFSADAMPPPQDPPSGDGGGGGLLCDAATYASAPATSLTCTATDGTTVNCAWTLPLASSTAYNEVMLRRNGVTVLDWKRSSGTARPSQVYDYGLPAGSQNTYAINVVENDRCATWSPNVETTVTQPPGSTTLSAVPGDRKIDLSWPAAPGAAWYGVYYGVPSTGQVVTAATNLAATNFTLTGLANNTAYNPWIVPYNNSGTGPNATAPSVTTAPAAPSIAVGFEGYRKYVVVWDHVSGATQYVVNVDGASAATVTWGGGSAMQYVADTPSDPTADNRAYTVKVYAVNSNNTSSGVSNTVTATTAPATPTSVTATGGTRAVTLSWSSSTGATGYDLARNGATNAPMATSLAALTYTDTSLADGTSYTYQVRARRNGTLGAWTNAATATTLPAAQTLSFSRIGATSIDMSWAAVSTATSYSVYRDGTLVLTRAAGGSVSYTDTGLTPDTNYTYRLDVAASSGTTAGNGVTPRTAPATPTVTATAGTNAVTLSWSAPSLYATSYRIYTGSSTSGPWSQVGTTSATNYTLILAGACVTQYVQVRAVNGMTTPAGEGDPQGTAPTVKTLPYPPLSGKAADSGGQVLLTWTANSANSGCGAVTYQFQRNGGSWTNTDTGSSSLDPVSSATPYTYSLRTVSASFGTSASSAGFTNLPGTPARMRMRVGF